MKGLDLDSWLSGVFTDIYRPRPAGGTLAWVEENCFVPPEVSPDFSGFYRIDPSPLIDIMFDFYDSPEWDELILPKGSQYGGSQGAHCISMADAYWKGRNIALLLDSRPEAIRVSQTRLKPLIRHCKPLASGIAENDDGLANLTLSLKGLTFFLMGSFSPSALANKTIGLGIADECDNYPPSPKGESNALDLLRDRLKKVSGSKLIAFSKPKDEETLIWPEFLSGSRHKCFVPCPRCETYQELTFAQVDYRHCKDLTGAWDYDLIERETFYRCVRCGGVIEEKEKRAMIGARLWRPTNLRHDFAAEKAAGRDFHVEPPTDGIRAQPRKMSAHVSDLYALGEKDTWGRIAAEWVGAQGNLSKLQRIKRGRLALPWSEGSLKIEKSDLDRMLAGYQRGQCPFAPDVVLFASDVQKDLKKWAKAAFRIDGTCWVVDWGECLTFAGLADAMDQPVKVLNWEDTPENERFDPVVRRGLIDEGGGDGRENDNQGPVRDFAISTFTGMVPTPDGGQVPDYRFFTCYGRGGLATKNWRDAFEPKNYVHKGWPSVVYRFNDDLFKREMYEERIAKFRAWHAAKLRGDMTAEKPVPLHFPISRPGEADGVSWDQFRSEMSQERREWDGIRRRHVWRDPSEPNDFGDALKMCFVGFYVLLPTLIAEKSQRDLARKFAAAPVEDAVADAPGV